MITSLCFRFCAALLLARYDAVANESQVFLLEDFLFFVFLKKRTRQIGLPEELIELRQEPNLNASRYTTGAQVCGFR